MLKYRQISRMHTLIRKPHIKIKSGSENEDILEKYWVNSMEIHIFVAFI